MNTYNEHLGLTIEETLEKHKGLVGLVFQKMKYKFPRNEWEDLEQLCFIGLVKAYEGYDPKDYGTKFSTYAVPKIFGETMRYLRDNDTNVKFPRIIKEIWWKMDKLSDEELENETPESFAEKFGYEVRFVEQAFKYRFNRSAISIQSKNRATKDDGEDLTLEDTLSSTTDYSTAVVRDFLSTLDERTQKILYLTMERDLTQREIGDIVGVSQVQVSRIIRKVQPLWEEYAS